MPTTAILELQYPKRGNQMEICNLKLIVVLLYKIDFNFLHAKCDKHTKHGLIVDLSKDKTDLFSSISWAYIAHI